MDHDQNVVHRETITSDEEILKIPISLSVGSPEKRLKIYATYTRVPIAGEPAPGPNRPGNRDELRGPYDAFSRTFNNTGSENTRSNLPSTRGMYHFCSYSVSRFMFSFFFFFFFSILSL